MAFRTVLNSPTLWEFEASSDNKDAGTLAAIYAALQVVNEGLEAVERILDIVGKIKGLFGRSDGVDLAPILTSLSLVHAKLDLLIAGMAHLASREDLEDARMRERAENILASVNTALIQRDLLMNGGPGADSLKARLNEKLSHYLSASMELWEQAPVIVVGFQHHLELCPAGELPGWKAAWRACAQTYLAKWKVRNAALVEAEEAELDAIKKHIEIPRFQAGWVKFARWNVVDAWVTVTQSGWRRSAHKVDVVAKLFETIESCHETERRTICRIIGRPGDVCVSNGGCHGHVDCSDFFGQVWEPYERELERWNHDLGAMIQRFADAQAARRTATSIIQVLEAFLREE